MQVWTSQTGREEPEAQPRPGRRCLGLLQGGVTPTCIPLPPPQSVGRHQRQWEIQQNFRAVFLHSPAVSQEGGHRAGDREGLEKEEKQEVLFKFQYK